MEERISESEYRFLEILWELEPVSSTVLVRHCLERLGWKKSTTYTVIKKLSDKHAVHSQDAVVTALVKREEVQRRESNEFVEKRFHGSLPSFMAAFLQDRRLTQEEAMRLKKMIEGAVEIKPEGHIKKWE